MKTKIKYKPLILYVFQVLAILMLVDSTLFFDFDASESPKPKLNSYWVYDNSGKPEWLIANYGQVEFKVPLPENLISRDSDHDHIVVTANWPGFSIPWDEFRVKWRDRKIDRKTHGTVSLRVTYNIYEDLPERKANDLRFNELSPPSRLYQKLGGSNDYYFMYNGSEYSLSCPYDIKELETNPSRLARVCVLRMYIDRDIHIYIDISKSLVLNWDLFIEDFLRFLDRITIQSEER